MDNDSIDSCVTDPPYGISFMGKGWDNFSNSKNIALGGQSPANEKSGVFKQRGKPIGGWSDEDRKAVYNFQKWTEEWSKEVYRVLKPGSFLLSFCSPRMYHRMVCGIEGFNFVGIEMDSDYFKIAESRISSEYNRGLKFED